MKTTQKECSSSVSNTLALTWLTLTLVGPKGFHFFKLLKYFEFGIHDAFQIKQTQCFLLHVNALFIFVKWFFYSGYIIVANIDDIYFNQNTKQNFVCLCNWGRTSRYLEWTLLREHFLFVSSFKYLISWPLNETIKNSPW